MNFLKFYTMYSIVFFTVCSAAVLAPGQVVRLSMLSPLRPIAMVTVDEKRY